MSDQKPVDTAGPAGPEAETPAEKDPSSKNSPPKEIGGRKGPEPTRYGDWERNGIASDF